MSATITENVTLKGGEFLIKDSNYQDLFIPEDFNEEQLMVKETVKSFVEQEIHPYVERIEKLEEGLIPSILDKFAELGLLGTHMPESLGGSNLDYITNTIIGEEVGPSGSFSVSYNAHTGIGMLPILYYGTEVQKQKYLPKLITGELKSSYCLTEPSSGSDALSAKSTAVLNAEGTHYILNGQKMWITNAGFADIFTVFAQVDGDKFTGFILEKGMEGFTLGAEEKKLGIKGSSTRQIFMENVKVPKENLLGEVGKGHLIAFNVLNTGRFKLGASCLGGCKKITSVGIQYANEREQFKTPISSFGAIQYKLAEQAIRNFVTETAVYRTAQLIQNGEIHFKETGSDFAKSKLEAAEEYALECSIIKIIGSETLDYVVDETVQIFGGMGYSEEGIIARAYRDSRINRIFEGTNEINRMVMLSTILKSAMKGELDLMTPGMAVQNELMNGTSPSEVFVGNYAIEQQAVANFKKVLIMLLGTAAQQAMSGQLNLKTEQEILMNLADIITEIFNAESTLMRVMKIAASYPDKDIDLYNAILRTHLHDATSRVTKQATDAIASFVVPEMQGAFISGLRKFTKYPLQNVKENRRKIASVLIAAGEYSL
ncbi:MAG TPA: acyl-CoA dehydrogenase family protein [Saprospiraceae bacterium]|nr:acyl-CoA dehydrogenase family protein [Saprospiraceae bacterium]